MSNAFNLSQLANNVDATGKLSASAGVTGTLPVANGGTGLATLTANNVMLGNGTSAPTFVAPSTNGNVLTSNGTTWTSVAPSGGGVTSLNGQTDAITNTTQYAIGSYILGRPQNTTQYNNSTIAGSSLYAAGSQSFFRVNIAEEMSQQWGSYLSNTSASPTTIQSLVNTGSWRCVSITGRGANAGSITYGDLGLWVRYA